MSIDLTFDGTTACLGRHGWFPLGAGVLYQHSQQGGLWLDLYHEAPSTTQVSIDPRVTLTFHHQDDLKTLICGLAKALAQMTTISEENTP